MWGEATIVVMQHRRVRQASPNAATSRDERGREWTDMDLRRFANIIFERSIFQLCSPWLAVSLLAKLTYADVRYCARTRIYTT